MSIIKTVKGDLLDMFDDHNFDAIVHGCNCFHTMGSGIAKQIKARYPAAYEADKETYYGNIDKLGMVSKARILGKGFVFNAYTQFNPGPNCDYEAIKFAFIEINSCAKRWFEGGWRDTLEERYTIGIPMIGAGIAGGDWNKIYSIIDTATPDCDIVVVEWSK